MLLLLLLLLLVVLVLRLVLCKRWHSEKQEAPLS
jgi:hypothetical protein